jgi:GDP-4-dehydro-6-deoxy-D-mannose reductase
MPPRTILVTGAGGFVGQHLMPALRAAFPQARVLGTGLTGDAQLALNITDEAVIRAVMASEKPDFCVHLAGIAAIGAARADPAQTWAVNCFGALNVGRAILAEAPACGMLFISSSEVYGASFKPGLALDETAPLAPMNVYAATKAAAEMGLCALAADGLRVVRLRPFNHTGPGQRDDFVVPAFAGQIARIEAGLAPPELLVGTLDTERDFLDIRDVCAAYIACIRHFGQIPNNQALNIATGSAIRIGAMLDMLLAQATCPIRVKQDPARLRPSEIMRAAGNPQRAMQLLNWQPTHRFAATLATVLAAARLTRGVGGDVEQARPGGSAPWTQAKG